MVWQAVEMDAPFVSEVIHQARVEVDELGTEAAAATAACCDAAAAEEPTVLPFMPNFRADHPFLWMIVEKASGAVLFAGRFMKPEQA